MTAIKENILISAKQCIIEFCTNCNSSNLILKTALEGINEYIEDITARLQRGTQPELSSFIDENFKIPLGLKLHLTNFLTRNYFHASATSITSKTVTSTRHLVYNANLSTNEAILVKVLEEWKMGNLLPEKYYTYIHNLVVKGALSTEAAQKLIHFSLQRASWEINKVDCTNGMCSSPKEISSRPRISCISTACELEDVHSLCCKAHSLTINGRNRAFSQIDMNGNTLREAKCYHSEKFQRYPTKSGLVWWEHRRSFENMSMCGTVAQHQESANEGSNILRQPSAKVESKLILIIGDSIECSDGVLEIDEVITVDAWTPSIPVLLGAPSKSSTMYNIVILVDGRLTYPTKTQLIHECDGASEIGDEEELLNPSNGSGNDENSGQNKTCGFVEACRKYFFLYASYHRGMVHVCHSVELNQYLISDQIPCNVLCVGPELAVVSGTNGLLGILPLDINAPTSTGSNQDTSTKEHGDIREYISLTKDIIAEGNTENASATPIHLTSHQNSTAVTLTSFSSNSSILVSGDTDGLLCWWKVGSRDERYRSSLIASYTPNTSERLHSIQISPNGCVTAVGLHNSLILLRQKEVTLGTESDGSSPICSIVPVPACLDFIENMKPRYSVSFEKDLIHIWRICKHNSHHSRSRQPTSRACNLVKSTSSPAVVENSVVDDEANNLRATKEGTLSSRKVQPAQQIEVSYWHHKHIDAFEMRLSELRENEETFINTLLEKFTRASSSSGLIKWNLSHEKRIFNSMSSVDLALINNDLSPREITHAKVLQCGNLETVSAVDLSRYDYISTGDEFVPLVDQYQDFSCLIPENEAYEDVSMEVEERNWRSAVLLKSVGEVEKHSTSLPLNHSSSDQVEQSYVDIALDKLKQDAVYIKMLDACFIDDFSPRFCKSKAFLAVFAAVTSLQATAQLGFVAAALDMSTESLLLLLKDNLDCMVQILPPTGADAIDNAEFSIAGSTNTLNLRESMKGGLLGWICSTEYSRLGGEYWIDPSIGHNKVCALYLKYCANKSVAVECPWQDYLRTYGPTRKN